MTDGNTPNLIPPPPPPPPPPGPASPPPAAPAGYDQGGTVPGYGQTGPVPGYEQTGPVPGYEQTGPVRGYGQTGPVPGYEQTGPVPGYGQTSPVPGYGQTAHGQPAYSQAGQEPPFGVDTTGVPALQLGSARAAGSSFFKALFDLGFTSFITRKLASVIYVIGLVVIGLSAVVMLFGGLASAVASLGSSYTQGLGVMMLFGSLIGVPVGALAATILLRLGIESVVALVAVAENTERTAANTDQPKAG